MKFYDHQSPRPSMFHVPTRQLQDVSQRRQLQNNAYELKKLIEGRMSNEFCTLWSPIGRAGRFNYAADVSLLLSSTVPFCTFTVHLNGYTNWSDARYDLCLALHEIGRHNYSIEPLFTTSSGRFC